MTRAIENSINNFDLVYIVAVWNYPTAIAAYYCRKNKKPYIISPRGLLYPCVLKKKFYKKWLYYNLVTKRDLKLAAAIHYTSLDEKEACHEFLGLENKAFVVPNGINPAEFNNLPDARIFRERYPVLKNKKIILFLGRINWKKGLDILLDAYGVLAKEREDVHLVVAGNDEGGYIEKVKERVANLGLKRRVIFTGIVNDKVKLEAFAASDVFILPSYSENFGIAAVEAMACARPVIISERVGISREVKENNAGLVAEFSAEGIYRAIKLFLDNPAQAKILACNGQKMAIDSYNIESVAERMLDVFREVC
jgi:glycosyltransferase involved in cell wall biosynthesis